MRLDERKRVVRAGYDRLAPQFEAWMRAVEGDPWERFLDALASRLEDGAHVLDLGCGAGLKTRRIAERFDVLGVDISREQIARARAQVPGARFVEVDFTGLDLPPGSFDAITAFYSISHVPREEHADLFANVARWLRPGGLFLASLGARGSEDWTGEWLGVEMFFSSHDADENRRLLEEAGFRLLMDEVVTMLEPEGEATFLWVVAERWP